MKAIAGAIVVLTGSVYAWLSVTLSVSPGRLYIFLLMMIALLHFITGLCVIVFGKDQPKEDDLT